MNRMSKEEILKLVTMYETGNFNFKALDLYFNRGLGTCRGLLQRRGHLAKSISEINRKYSLKEDFFEKIDTEQKAYFLGLLYADGCNFPEGTRIIISLIETDKEILEKFKECLDYKRPLYYKKGIGNSKPQYTLTISSKRISKDLEAIGLVKAKSLILKYPNIPKEYNQHFIRGYFDGDGCIVKHATKKDYKWNILGTEDFCKSVQNILIEELGLNVVKLYKSRNIYTLTYKGGKQVRKICDWMYNNSSIFLIRKHIKYKNFI